MLLWKPNFSANLTILSGRSYTEQGGFPWAHATRNKGKFLILNEALDNSETGVDYKWGLNQQPGSAVIIQPGTVIQIDSEQMLVTAATTTSMTVTRAYAGTTGVAHSDQAAITIISTGDGVIDRTGIAWGAIEFPAEWTAANLAVFGCSTRDGTFVPVRDETGVALYISGIATAAANIQILPSKIFAGVNFLKFRSITVGTDPTSAVAQGADRTLIFHGGE